MKKRILFSKNGTLTDYTSQVSNYYNGEMEFSFVADQDAIYIGSILPFNHFFVKIGTTVNSLLSNMQVSYWEGQAWASVIDIIDETSVAGATLGQSGFVNFVPSKSKNWARWNTNYAGQKITGLENVEIYDLYWLKISFTNNLTNDVSFDWIGNIFNNDSDLGSEFPDLVRSSLKTAYQAGKTSWEEQAIRSAEIMEKDLGVNKTVASIAQILDKNDLTLAGVSKTAELIYLALGDDYVDQAMNARKEYERRINSYFVKVDKNLNAIVDLEERFFQEGRLYR